MEEKTKKTTKKVAPKAEKTVKTEVPKKPEANVSVKTTSKSATVTVDVLGKDGKKASTMSVPASIFGAKISPTLMAQAVRVYRVNQRQGTADSKTRSEVAGSRKKVWQQKGTGRARHGARSGPVFVGGGIVHGPHPRNFVLSLPQKMKKASLASALTSKLQAQQVVFADGVSDLSKTREVEAFLKSAGLNDSNMILVIGQDNDSLRRAARNLALVTVLPAHCLNTYEVLHAKRLLFVKNGVEELQSSIFK